MDYPKFADYIAALAERDKAIASVAFIAFIAVAWLWITRFSHQEKTLPILRVGLVAAFYGSFVLVVVGTGMGWFK
jgi:hypothetical protein